MYRVIGALLISLTLIGILNTITRRLLVRIAPHTHYSPSFFIGIVLAGTSLTACLSHSLTEAIAMAAVLVLLGILAEIDRAERILPNALIGALFVFVLSYKVIFAPYLVLGSLLVAIAVGTFQIIFQLLLRLVIAHKFLWGGGDFKLVCVFGFLFADRFIWWIGLWSIVFVILAGIYLLSRIWNRKDAVALGPSLCCTAQIVFCVCGFVGC